MTFLGIWHLAFGHSPLLSAEPSLQPGLLATFRAGDKTDDVVFPNFAFYAAQGTPTPFLSTPNYEAEFSALLSVDLRNQYTFESDLNGTLQLQVNGKKILEATAQGARTERSNPVRLNRGTNSIIAKFTPPAHGDGYFRLYWTSKGAQPNVIPQGAITHLPTEALIQSKSLRHGRTLLAEYRCLKCHDSSAAQLPESTMDAPSFDAIGNRLTRDWMARWIQDPKANRTDARMPLVLHGPDAAENALTIATFLSTLRESNSPVASAASPEHIQKGQQLFESLRCATCHIAPGEDVDPGRLALGHVTEKFQPGALAEFLLKPEAHYAWIRMPNFKLSSAEAQQLAAFLQSKATSAKTVPSEGKIASGKNLVQTTGCLNCHSLNLPNDFKTKSLAQITNAPDSGCLDPESKHLTAPRFAFSAPELSDLKNFLRNGSLSVSQDNPREFALRQIPSLNCAGCHAKAEDFTSLELLGDKLKPQWAAAFIAGEIPQKPRPWLPARMPAFSSRATQLARGLAMLHGFPPATPPEPAPNPELVEIGRKLISANGGFSCIACHALGQLPAQVAESPGVNFAWSAARLQRDFFHRWLMNPLVIDPATKMPAYFDAEGRSQLTDILDGDGAKQIEAMWHYLRLGDKMPPPN